MTRTSTTLGLVLLLSTCAAAPSSALSTERDLDIRCGDRSFLLSTINETGAIRSAAIGTSGDATVRFNFNPASGRWVITLTSEDMPGVTCLVARGTGFRRGEG